jgi:small subunit ribosomal protein S16
VAVKIRLKRMGKIRAPFYRVVVMDSRTKRDGRAIEEIGKYHPTDEPSLIDISSERALHWLGQGAQPTEAVEALLKVTGDWQKFKGIDGTEGTLRVKEPKTSKKELYEAAVAAAGASLEAKDGATTPKKRAAKSAEPRAAEPQAEPKTVEPKVAEPEAAEPKAAEPETAEPKAGEPQADAAQEAPPAAAAVDAPADKVKADDPSAADTTVVDPSAADTTVVDPETGS